MARSLVRLGSKVPPIAEPSMDRISTFVRGALAATGPGPLSSGAKPRLRILLNTHNLKYEGAPISALGIATAIAADPRLELVVASHKRGPVGAEFEDIDLRITGVTPRYYAEHPRRARAVLAALLRAARPDVVHANTLVSFPVVDAAMRADVPVLWTVRESVEQGAVADHFVPRAIWERAVASDRVHFTFVADSTRDAVLGGFGRDRSTVVRNRLDRARLRRLQSGARRDGVRAELGLGRHDVAILCVAAFSDRKRQHALLDAFESIARSRPAAVLILAGRTSSAYSESVMARVEVMRRRGLRILVEPLSQSSAQAARVARLYVAADLFALVSANESYPRVILEAQAAGLAVIATRTFGTSEQVTDGLDGLLVPVDDATALAVNLATLVDDADLRTRLGRSGRAKRSVEDESQSHREYRRLYEHLAEGPKS